MSQPSNTEKYRYHFKTSRIICTAQLKDLHASSAVKSFGTCERIYPSCRKSAESLIEKLALTRKPSDESDKDQMLTRLAELAVVGVPQSCEESEVNDNQHRLCVLVRKGPSTAYFIAVHRLAGCDLRFKNEVHFA